MKRLYELILMVAFVGLIFGQSASALESGPFCAEFTNTSTDWYETLSIPKFDPSLGVLDKVTLEASACASQHFRIDNEDSINQCYEVDSSAVISTPMPDGSTFIIELPLGYREFCLGADSETGNGDYIGDDSNSFFVRDCIEDVKEIEDPTALQAWTGPGTVSFTTTAEGICRIEGAANFDSSIRTFANETICVTYEYRKLSISGSKISDCTDDGLEGWTIELKDSGDNVIDTTVTDGNGDYSFGDLIPGSYTVCEVPVDGWTAVGPTCIDVTLATADVDGMDFRNRADCTITTTPFSVCPETVVDEDIILENVDTTGCSGDPTVTIDPAGKTYTVSCTSIAGCPCSASGSWSVYDECTLTTEPFSVCPDVTVTEDMILQYVDTADCANDPTVVIDPAGMTYTVSCTNADGCICSGGGYWSVLDLCDIVEIGALEPCPDTLPTSDEIEALVTCGCDDAVPVVTDISRDPVQPDSWKFNVTCARTDDLGNECGILLGAQTFCQLAPCLPEGYVCAELVTMYQHEDIGQVDAEVVGGDLVVTFITDGDDPWEIEQAAVSVGLTTPTGSNPASFTYQLAPGEDTITIPLSDLGIECEEGIDSVKTLNIAAWARASQNGDPATAKDFWGYGYRYGKPAGMYFRMYVYCDCCP